MADNVTMNTGTGGAVAATDDVAGVHYQKVKLADGTADSATAIAAGGGVEANALRVTIASDSTGVVSVDDNGASLTVDATGAAAHDAGVSGAPVLVGGYASAAAPTDVSADGDAVRAWMLRSGAMVVQPSMGGVLLSAGNGASGTGVQRVTIANDSTGVLATVTNVATIGTSVTPGTGAAHLGKAEDAAHSSGDTGVMVLAVRNDAGTALAGTTGDYIPLSTDSSGALRVTGGGGGTQYAEDAAHTTGDSGTLALVVRKDTATQLAGTDGDYSALITDSNGRLHVNVGAGGIAGLAEDSAAAGGEDGVMMLAVRRDVASSGVSADGDFAALSVDSNGALRVSGASGTTQYTEDGASAGGESLCLAGTVRRDTAASSAGTDGDYATLNTDANGRLHVITGPSTGTIEVVGDVAHDAAAAGNPMLTGAYASAAAPTDVSADGDAVRLWALRNGSQVVNLAAGGALIGATSNALDVNIKSGAGSGGTAMADDAAFTAATTSVTPIGAFFDDTATDSVDENDIGAVRMSANRNLYVRIRDNAGNERGLNIDAAGAATVNLAAGTNTNEVVGDVAHDAVAAGNPLLMGAYASAAAPTDVSADADAVRLWALRSGALATQPTFGGVLASAGNGTSGTGTLRVTVASDSTGQITSVGGAAQDAAIAGNPVPVGMRASTATPTAMSADGDVVYPWATREGAQVIAGAIVDDAAFTPGTSRVVPIGFQADETATDSVDEGDAGTPRMTLDRKVITTSYVHAAAGGATPYKNLDCDETEDDIKTSPGKLFWIHVINLTASKRYIKFYNATAANVTVGTTTPVLSFPVPTMGDTNGAGFTIHFGDLGVQFDTAISVAATTGFADNDTGAPGTNDVILNAGYA